MSWDINMKLDSVRTLEAYQAVLDRYTFKGVMSLFASKLVVRRVPGTIGPSSTVEMHAIWNIPDRNTGEIIEFRAVKFGELYWNEATVRTVVEEWLEDIWEHEFWESLNFDGRRVRELHG